MIEKIKIKKSNSLKILRENSRIMIKDQPVYYYVLMEF